MGDICCDYCRDIVRYYLDCPICRATYHTPTDIWGEFYADIDDEFKCESCKTTFTLVEGEGCDPRECIWEYDDGAEGAEEKRPGRFTMRDGKTSIQVALFSKEGDSA